MNPIDLQLLINIQSFPEYLLPFTKALSFIGSFPALLCVIIFIMYTINYKLAIKLLLLLSTSSIINGILKTSLRIPRPYEQSAQIKAYSVSKAFNGYSMPSNYSQNSTAVYGTIITFQTIFRVIILILLLCVITISRMYLGEITFIQSIAGIITGIGIMYVFHKIQNGPFITIFFNFPERKMVLYVMVFTLSITACSATNLLIFNDLFHNSFGIGYETVKQLFLSSGLLAGGTIGSIKFIKRFSIQNEKKYSIKIIRFLAVSILSLILLYPVNITQLYISQEVITGRMQFFGTVYFIYLLYLTYGFLLTYIFPILLHKFKLMKLTFNYLD